MYRIWYRIRLSQPWRNKAPVLITFPYLALYLAEIPFKESFPYLILSVITIVGIAGIGYFLNDITDLASDREAGKTNAFSEVSLKGIIALALTLVSLAFLPWFFFPMDQLSWILIVGEIMVFALYSVKPFRFKRIVFLAPLLDAAYAHGMLTPMRMKLG